ncbi:DUF2085 domain-containing protein [Thermodesulfobacteriota bacterium]
MITKRKHLQKIIIFLPILIILSLLVISSFDEPITFSTQLHVIPVFFSQFLSIICHQRPERSFFINEIPIALCSRCIAFYLGFLGCVAFGIISDLKFPKSRWWLLLVLPLAFDGTTQLFQFRESTNFIRAITGILAAIGCSMILLPEYYRMVMKWKNGLAGN